jgi:hypothetical protein
VSCQARVRRRKKRVVGRVLGVCVYSLRSWASVGKQSAAITRQIGRCGKTSRERCWTLLACLHVHPRRKTTLNGEPTTRLLAWEIAVVDCFFQGVHCIALLSPLHHRDPPARAIYFIYTHRTQVRASWQATPKHPLPTTTTIA